MDRQGIPRRGVSSRAEASSAADEPAAQPESGTQAEGGDRISSGSTVGRSGEQTIIPAKQQPVGEQHATLDHGASCSSALTAAEGNPAAVGSHPGKAHQAVSGGPAAAEDGSVRFSVLRFGDGSIFRAPVRHLGGGSSLAHSTARASQKEVIDICDSDTDNADLLALPAPESPASPLAPAGSNPTSRDCLEDDMSGDPAQSPPRNTVDSNAGGRHQATPPIRRTGGQQATPQTASPRVLKRIRHPDPQEEQPAAQRTAVGGGNTPRRASSGGAAAEGGEPPSLGFCATDAPLHL